MSIVVGENGEDVAYDRALMEQTCNKSADIFKFLQTEMDERMLPSLQQEMGQNPHYKHLFGVYWLMEDRLRPLDNKSNNKIHFKENDFRTNH